MSFLRNAWYVAAWADEIQESQLLARKLLGEHVVLYRDNGKVHALKDSCPHRFAPLSFGRLVDGALECPYHGLAFEASGRCVRNPHGPITEAMAVDCYAVVETYRSVWIWMGEQHLADPSMIPDFSFLDSGPETAFQAGYFKGEGHYQLYVDNLLDLSHVDYLHADTLGGGSLTRATPRIEDRPDGVVSVGYYTDGEVPMQIMLPLLPEGTDRVDVWTEVQWRPPALIRLDNGFCKAGEARETSLVAEAAHYLTPETETTTHYFFAGVRNYMVDDADFNAYMLESRTQTFAREDGPMIAAQQERMGDADFWALKPVLLSVDRAPGMVRRRMDKRIAEEASSRQPAAVKVAR